MPWGELYIQPFTGRCLTRAAFTFGPRLPSFRAACEKLGAKSVPHGDAGYAFPFFGPYAMEILVWEGTMNFLPAPKFCTPVTLQRALPPKTGWSQATILISHIKSAM